MYRVSPQKAERQIFSTLRATFKSGIFFTSLVKASIADENDTKIIKFGWVSLLLCPFLEIQSLSNFAWFLRPMSVEFCIGKGLSYGVFGEAHWSERCHIRPLTLFLLDTDQWASPKHHMKGHCQTQLFAHRSPKSSEIWKWLCFKKWA